jgi:RNA polymerase sigma-70 factor (ECF subfamily)
VAAVNSALQRARAALKVHLPERRLDWAAAEPTAEETAVLSRYMAAVQGADLGAVAELLAEDVRAAMPPYPMWYSGREAVLATLAISWDPDSAHYVGQFRTVATRANRRPAMALYLRAPGDTEYRAFAIGTLWVRDGRVAEMIAFHDPRLFPAFGLPDEFSPWPPS